MQNYITFEKELVKEHVLPIVIVVSAMSGETNRLISLAHEVQDRPVPREMDVLVSTGEQVTVALLAMALVWDLSLHPTVGVVNQTLASGCGTWVEIFLGFGWLPWVDGSESWYSTSCADEFPNYIGDKKYAMPKICFIGIWQAFGFNMVLYLAGLTGVPRELYHAAAIDGVKAGWDRFRLVTWPMLGPTTVFVVTITAIRSFQVFDTVEALTLGGPVKTTYVMMYAIFEKAIRENLVGFGSAITVVFLIFVLIITFSQRYLVERRVHYS